MACTGGTDIFVCQTNFTTIMMYFVGDRQE